MCVRAGVYYTLLPLLLLSPGLSLHGVSPSLSSSPYFSGLLQLLLPETTTKKKTRKRSNLLLPKSIIMQVTKETAASFDREYIIFVLEGKNSSASSSNVMMSLVNGCDGTSLPSSE